LAKDSLKRRGCRWSDGSDGLPGSRYIDVDESKPDEKIAFLKAEIFLRDVEPLETLTALSWFPPSIRRTSERSSTSAT
jgi:DNA polymerase-3 subunit epsilon